MKHTVRTTIFALIGLAMMLGVATSCTTWDDGWSPAPPQGWNYFYDKTLTGTWVLGRINNSNVRPSETNYMYFNGRGGGWYYYYRNGALMKEQIAYWCQSVGNGSTQINVQYASGSASTMLYWFTDGGDSLWLSWNTPQGTVTYIYYYTNSIP